MKQSSAPLVAASAVMLICGFYNMILNLLRRAVHFLGTVREAARLDTDYTDPGEWKNIAVSVYDIFVIVRLSSGILAALQLAAAAAGLLFAALYAFRKKTPKGTWIPAALGFVCTAAGVVYVASAAFSGSAGAFMLFLLALTGVAVPLSFTILAVRFRRGIIKKEQST